MRGLWVCEIIMHYKKTQCLYGSFNASSSQNTVQTFKVYQSNSIYVWSDRKAALMCNNTYMQIMVLKYVSGQDEMWLAVSETHDIVHLDESFFEEVPSGKWGRKVCSQGEDMRESGGNRAEGRKQQRRSREQVLLTWGGKGCRLGIPSSG